MVFLFAVKMQEEYRMDRMKVAQFLKKRKVIGGCLAVVAAGIITAAGLYGQFAQLPEVPEIVDPILETSLEEEDTPLASAPKVTVKTTRTTKTTKKNVKLKKKATRTYIKNLGTQTKRNSKTVKRGTTTIKTDTTVQTNTSEKYTNKSIKKVVTTKVTTTVKTTTTVQQAVTATKAAAVTVATPATTSGTVVTTSTGSGTKTVTASTTKTITANASNTITTNVAGSSGPTEVSIRDVAPAMDEAVLRAFEKLRFRVIIDPTVSYSGRFVAKTRSITLKKWDTTVYHELGHFIAFVAGNVDKTSDFEAIYKKELSSFPGVYKAYASQNASEFFGECTRLYITEKSSLKSHCPQTVTAIEQAIRKLTDVQIQAADRAITIAGG
jgi:hypothetical protein